MAKKDDYVRLTEEIASPIAEDLGLELVDVEFVKEGSSYYLRIYADKEGGITIDDCEKLSRACEVVIDEKNYIDEAYIFEVSSPGLTRPLKKDKDFARNVGKVLEIKAFKAVDGNKEIVGKLIGYDDKTIIINRSWEDDGEDNIVIDRDNLALVRLYIIF